MSHSGRPIQEMGLHSLRDRFQDSFTIEHNKPDFKELDLGTSPSMASHTPFVKRSNGNGTAPTHSGDLETRPTTSEKLRSVAAAVAGNSKPGHRRSNSTGAPLIYSGCRSHHNSSSTSTGSSTTTTTTNSGGGGGSCGSGCASSVSSPNSNLYPSGNICPSGKILKSNMGSRSSNRTEKLGSGTANYGHGSIIKASGAVGGGGGGKLECNVSGNIQFAGESSAVKRAISSSDPEEVKRAGNELYRRGNFLEALLLYERAIGMSPDNVAYRSNRAAALTMLGRFGEAVRECEEAVRLEPGYGRAHQRLASLYLRLGEVENARRHLCFHVQQPDTTELQKLHLVEKHINRCTDARKIGDWTGALKECDAAMVAGAVSSPQIISCKAEAFLKLQKLEDANSSLSDLPKLEPCPASCSQVKFFGMLCEAYVLYVQAQVDMAMGRFENATAAAEKAGLIDYSNIEVAMLLNNVKLVTRARARGKDLFDSGNFSEACSAYGEGLKYNLCNSLLYCNRAVCWSKLGLWEQSVEDCSQALKIHPNYTKALLRRAVSNAKLERWAEAVRDYEVLGRDLPGDNEVLESLSRAQDALKKSRWEDVNNVKFRDRKEESSLGRFKAVIP